MNDLIPIGRFSAMTRLSVKALRHYAELGLLEPAWVDPASNYRYYRPAQANVAEAIRVLRRVDMPLDEIAEVLGEDDPDMIGKRLHIHRERLQERLADQERMLRYLEHLIEREEGLMPYEVTIKQVAPQYVAGYRIHTNLRQIGADIGTGFGILMQGLGAAQAMPAGAPFIIYHDVIDEQTPGDVELCVPVAPGTVATGGPVTWEELQGATVASTVHRGPYDQIAPAYHTIAGWIQDHGHETVGPPREIYLNDPQMVTPDELLTEVQFPIESAQS